MTKKLTAAALKRLKDSKPPSERLEVRDGGATGLYVVKYPTGAMSWAMKFRKPNGKLARTT